MSARSTLRIIMIAVAMAAVGLLEAEAAAAPKAPPALATASIHEEGETFEVGPEMRIFYHVLGAGKGTPLVVVNGGPGFDHVYLHCSDAWDRLAQGRRVVFYDQRGNGRSTPLAEGQTTRLLDQIADLDALRARLGAEKMDLLGHSWGGYLVMAYAARHPERIAHLTIVDAAAPKIQETAFLFRQIYPETVARQDAIAFAEALGDQAAIAASLDEYNTMLFYSPAARDAYLARAHTFLFRPNVNQMLWSEAERYDLNPELLKFRFPTLVVTGRYDFNVAPSVAYAIHQKVPGSEFAVFEKSGHLPFCEEVEPFVARIGRFLQGR